VGADAGVPAWARRDSGCRIVRPLTWGNDRCVFAGMPIDLSYAGRKLSPVTLRKELASFRALWNWSVKSGLLTGPFPNQGLVFPKTEEKPPFQTWEEIERQVREERDFAVLYCDLDNFKAYNDQKGFVRGDRLIQAAARIIQDAVVEHSGAEGFIGHVGGDDFQRLPRTADCPPAGRRPNHGEEKATAWLSSFFAGMTTKISTSLSACGCP